MAAQDLVRSKGIDTLSPITNGFSITKSDAAELAYVTRGIYVGVSGDLKVVTSEGDTVTFVGLASGIIHPIRAKQVLSTGTTATSIVGVY